MNELVLFKEALEITGYSRNYLYNLTGKGLIPCYNQGKRLIFKRSELEAWLFRCPKHSMRKEAKNE